MKRFMNNIVILTDKKEYLPSVIISIFAFFLIGVLLINLGIYFSVNDLFLVIVISLVLSSFLFFERTNAKNKIEIKRGDRYVSYIFTKKYKKYKGNIIWDKISNFEIKASDAFPELKESSMIDENELWKLDLFFEFKHESTEALIKISGKSLKFEEQVLKLINWDYLIKGNKNNVFYKKNEKLTDSP